MKDVTHIIPASEAKLHIESPVCKCEPVAEVHKNGHTTWVHQPLDLDALIDDLNVL